MRKLITAGLAAAAILVAGSLVWKVEAAPVAGAGTLPPLTQNSSPVENVGCWCGPYRCACRRHYGYYGYGYRPYYRPYRYRYNY
jgi:hypothetical protein